MGYYPIYLDLEKRRCLVIGGGPVAERKTEGLLEAGAAVTVISPRLTEKLAAWSKDRRIDHIAREYGDGDLDGFQLVFVATADAEVARIVHDEARKRRLWLNAADEPAYCDFILPSVLRRGELTIAVATGGRSPALSRAIREELESLITEDYGALVRIAADVRQALKDRGLPNGEGWRRALDGEFRRLVREGREEEARGLLMRRLTTQ